MERLKYSLLSWLIMKKRFLGVVIAILMLMLLVLSACGETNAPEKKIDELQQQIADLQQVVDAKDSEIEELNDQIKNQNKRIEELLKELRDGFSESVGIYTLQEAYDRGYLTKEDLEQIAYYINNGSSCPQPLDSSIENAIKESAAYEMRNRETHPYPEATAEDFTILKYYGSYSDYFVVSMNDCYDLSPADVPNYWEEIGGVQFHITNYDKIRVWIAK